MPITQDRMMALIKAGLDYQQALEDMLRFAKSLAADAEIKTISPDQAFRVLQNLSLTDFLAQPIDSARTLAVEHAHFTGSRVKRNERKAKALAASRQAQGLPTAPISTAPKSLIAPAKLHGSRHERLLAEIDLATREPVPLVRAAGSGERPLTLNLRPPTPEQQREFDAIYAANEARYKAEAEFAAQTKAQEASARLAAAQAVEAATSPPEDGAWDALASSSKGTNETQDN